MCVGAVLTTAGVGLAAYFGGPAALTYAGYKDMAAVGTAIAESAYATKLSEMYTGITEFISSSWLGSSNWLGLKGATVLGGTTAIGGSGYALWPEASLLEKRVYEYSKYVSTNFDKDSKSIATIFKPSLAEFKANLAKKEEDLQVSFAKELYKPFAQTCFLLNMVTNNLINVGFEKKTLSGKDAKTFQISVALLQEMKIILNTIYEKYHGATNGATYTTRDENKYKFRTMKDSKSTMFKKEYAGKSATSNADFQMYLGVSGDEISKLYDRQKSDYLDNLTKNIDKIIEEVNNGNVPNIDLKEFSSSDK